MKAKEYAEQITSKTNMDDAIKALGECGKGFLDEFMKMRKARNIKTDHALIPLIKEFDVKFRKFALLVNEKYKDMVKPNGFLELLDHISPSTADWYHKNSA